MDFNLWGAVTLMWLYSLRECSRLIHGIIERRVHLHDVADTFEEFSTLGYFRTARLRGWVIS